VILLLFNILDKKDPRTWFSHDKPLKIGNLIAGKIKSKTRLQLATIKKQNS
jgi:hypothetical protein